MMSYCTLSNIGAYFVWTSTQKSRKGSPNPMRSNCQSLPPGAETRHYIPPLGSKVTFCVDVCTLSDLTGSIVVDK